MTEPEGWVTHPEAFPPPTVTHEGKTYRLVCIGEVIKEGDLFISSNRFNEPMTTTSGVGRTYPLRTSWLDPCCLLYYYTPAEIFYTPEFSIFNEPILTPELLGELFDV